MTQMHKGLEPVLGQFTDGTSWKEAPVHCRIGVEIILKSWRNSLKLLPTGTSMKYDTVHLPKTRVRTTSKDRNSWKRS